MKERKLSYDIKDLGFTQTWKKGYSFEFDATDLLTVDDDFRDMVIEDLLFKFRISLQSTLYNGMWGNSTAKEMKESLEDLVVGKKKNKKDLKDLSFDDFDLLKKSGMLWVFYPDAPENYEQIYI